MSVTTYPALASAIKSIQRGELLMSGGGWFNVTVNPVDMDKSFISTSSVSGIDYGLDYAYSVTAGVKLTSATNLSFDSQLTGVSIRVFWELIEFN
jgi:hypothetical protein